MRQPKKQQRLKWKNITPQQIAEQMIRNSTKERVTNYTVSRVSNPCMICQKFFTIGEMQLVSKSIRSKRVHKRCADEIMINTYETASPTSIQSPPLVKLAEKQTMPAMNIVSSQTIIPAIKDIQADITEQYARLNIRLDKIEAMLLARTENAFMKGAEWASNLATILKTP